MTRICPCARRSSLAARCGRSSAGPARSTASGAGWRGRERSVGESAANGGVVLKGPGMTNPAIPHGIWVGGSVDGVTIANLTIRELLARVDQRDVVHEWRLCAGVEDDRMVVDVANPSPSGGGGANGIATTSVRLRSG